MDYWKLNFISFDAVDKEDIRMEATIEGKVEIMEGIMEYYKNNPKEMEGVTMELKDNKIEMIWEAESEINAKN